MARTFFCCMLCVGALSAVPLDGQAFAAAETTAAIRQAAVDYIEGWYTGDADRMERALHPDLAKRRVYKRTSRSPCW
jgi:hypothetical protein